MRRARHLSSAGVLEFAGIRRVVNLLHAHRLEAAALHWLGIRETNGRGTRCHGASGVIIYPDSANALSRAEAPWAF